MRGLMIVIWVVRGNSCFGGGFVAKYDSGWPFVWYFYQNISKYNKIWDVEIWCIILIAVWGNGYYNNINLRSYTSRFKDLVFYLACRLLSHNIHLHISANGGSYSLLCTDFFCGIMCNLPHVQLHIFILLNLFICMCARVCMCVCM